jgi:hypothetical protein
MSLLKALLAELRGMFAADLGLSLAVLLLIAALALALQRGLPPPWAGGLLVAGVLAILTASVLRAARRLRRDG